MRKTKRGPFFYKTPCIVYSLYFFVAVCSSYSTLIFMDIGAYTNVKLHTTLSCSITKDVSLHVNRF